MRKSLTHLGWMAAILMLQGCVGLGAWTLGTRGETSDHPKIDETRGAVNLRKTGPEAETITAQELRTRWGEPDRIGSRDDGKEEWVYKTGGLRWAGMILYLVVIPFPAMVPVGAQDVTLLIHEGRIEQATRRDWAFKAGAYCGFFGMVYGGLGCGAGTIEEQQAKPPGS